MAILFVRHKVTDFGAWKSAYDAFDKERKTLGVTGHGAYQTIDDPNAVTAYHEFKNIDEAKAFAGSARLKEVMEKAGVVGAPEIWFANKI